MSRLHRSPVAVIVLVGTLTGPASRAAPPDELERARQLFLQAEADEDADRWAEALEKLRAVSKVKLTAGVRYHVAFCEEHLGQLARALRDYQTAEEQARLDNAKDVLRTVGRQLAALDPRVPRLTVHVTPALPDTSVRLDGQPMAEAPGATVFVDPGIHYVEVRAPDRAASTQAVVLQERESRTLEITLSPSPSPTIAEPFVPTPPSTERFLAPASEVPSPSTPRAHRAPAIVATAISVGLAGGGVAAFLLAGAAHDRAVRVCGLLASPPDACDSLKAPVRAWDFTAAGSWLGALAAGVVAVVFWTRHDKAVGEGATSSARSRGTRSGVIIGPAPLGVGGQF